MGVILFRFVSITLLILVIAGCIGGKNPVETSSPEMTAAPSQEIQQTTNPPSMPTTEPPTTVPPTTAHPAFKTHKIGDVVNAKTPAIQVNGDFYDAGEITFQINSVEFSDTDPTYSSKSEEGSLYSVMDVVITNVGYNKVNFLYSLGYPKIKDSEGYTYSVYSSGLSWTMDLLPGEKIRGYLAAELPKEVIANRKLEFIADGETRITIALN